MLDHETTLKANRRSITLGEDGAARLQVLKSKTKVSSETAVIRDALRVYEWAVDEHLAGYQFYAEHKETGDKVRFKIL